VLHKLHKFLRLHPCDRRLLLEAWLNVCACRAALWLLPLSRWSPSPRVSISTGVPAARIAWAIGVASRYVPRATCLVRALAGRRLLAAHGHRAQLRIGVARSAGFEAHAWLEYNGRVLIGGGDLDRYTVLPLKATAT
jgi:hypothetical protein